MSDLIGNSKLRKPSFGCDSLCPLLSAKPLMSVQMSRFGRAILGKLAISPTKEHQRQGYTEGKDKLPNRGLRLFREKYYRIHLIILVISNLTGGGAFCELNVKDSSRRR